MLIRKQWSQLPGVDKAAHGGGHEEGGMCREASRATGALPGLGSNPLWSVTPDRGPETPLCIPLNPFYLSQL